MLSDVEPRPTSLKIKFSENCDWNTKELSVLNHQSKVVTFRYISCKKYDGESFRVSKTGTTIQLMAFDVVSDVFHIFERTDDPIDHFIMNLPQEIFEVGKKCKPKKLSDNFWIIDDGLPLAAEINSMPCGRYGRNFAGPAVFEVRDTVILNYSLQTEHDDIDKSSINYFDGTSP